MIENLQIGTICKIINQKEKTESIKVVTSFSEERKVIRLIFDDRSSILVFTFKDIKLSENESFIELVIFDNNSYYSRVYRSYINGDLCYTLFDESLINSDSFLIINKIYPCNLYAAYIFNDNVHFINLNDDTVNSTYIKLYDTDHSLYHNKIKEYYENNNYELSLGMLLEFGCSYGDNRLRSEVTAYFIPKHKYDKLLIHKEGVN